ncbi:MAG: DNA gyrase subunit A [Actinobacteria bacterium]|uniref:DNA topoisomerase (ATP-hydrolyzing) n=1 Tax=freshwater metagenome TaxID=449393 RepID=A0A6J6PJ85_9ZZZZ|nr:DNA gyrase subunit A [Actinomycetota bacterium]MSW22583.1 DNA gyrase subunit A [Actinomycetota bacterium]MSX04377.1 DNA gyrase subunit A [Actinomycetota bacterium]MSX83873.1 DNA gyrase subunit A [Actinomycetota bacterium]MSY96251.1 DNA gyrase subunit A [Actinomycetota bacterium]
MAENMNPDKTAAHDRIESVDLQVEMARSYLDYAMSVIVGRALPDIRDGLKPVHRRVLYAMYDAGYRPDKGYYKSSRIVGDVMGNYHPHGDTAIYDAVVRLAQFWSLRYPLIDGNGNFGSPGNDPAAAMRYTEAKLAPLAMEMMRDIDEDTVNFIPNYDGRSQEPTVLPSRFPNLLVNGSAGIAVGMATNIPPHNLNEVVEGVVWALENPDADSKELLEKLLTIVKGPDFPTKALIVGHQGIEDAYRTGRGSIIMRAVVEVEEINKRTCLVVTELPYQVNPDNLALKIAELVKDGRIKGIADVRDEGNERLGQRLVIVLRNDAIPKVILNNLYKHTQLQDSFGANMLALVDGVPRTLRIDEFIRYYIEHQVEVIVRRTKYRLQEREKRAHILQGYLKALDALDAVIALIRASRTPEEARTGLMKLLDVDEVQANAILDMQLRRIAALERQKINDEYEGLMAEIVELNSILASEAKQREIIKVELQELTAKYGNERRTQIIAGDSDLSVEDLIPDQSVVVTITKTGYSKRTKADLYRSQRRGGKGVKGAALKQDDLVEHFFVASTHDWLLFFTNKGRIYRAKVHELPDAGRDARGQHVANLLAFKPDETIAQVIAISDYKSYPYLAIATRGGIVKKSPLVEFDSPRSGGLIAINLKESDELVSAALVSEKDEILLVSKNGMSLRFSADEESIRSMGRSTSGVIGMKFRSKDQLLTMAAITDISSPKFVLTATDGGYAKRTPLDEYRPQGRGGLGVKAAKIDEDSRGVLVGAMIVEASDEILAITSGGVVIRTACSEIRETSRDTLGVRLVNLDEGISVVSITQVKE